MFDVWFFPWVPYLQCSGCQHNYCNGYQDVQTVVTRPALYIQFFKRASMKEVMLPRVIISYWRFSQWIYDWFSSMYFHQSALPVVSTNTSENYVLEPLYVVSSDWEVNFSIGACQHCTGTTQSQHALEGFRTIKWNGMHDNNASHDFWCFQIGFLESLYCGTSLVSFLFQKT